jgi:hypothetical protein
VSLRSAAASISYASSLLPVGSMLCSSIICHGKAQALNKCTAPASQVDAHLRQEHSAEGGLEGDGGAKLIVQHSHNCGVGLQQLLCNERGLQVHCTACVRACMRAANVLRNMRT